MSGDKPSGDKASGDKPSGDKPSGDKPSGDKPSGDKAPTVLRTLLGAPWRFGFDAALRLIMQRGRRGSVAASARLRASTTLGYPTSEILAVQIEPHATRVEVGLPGLLGAGGVLPRHYAGLVAEGGGAGLAAVVAMISERMLSGLADAGIKYRMERAAEAARLEGDPGRSMPERALLALAGFGGANTADRMPGGASWILQYAGFFAQGPRSADRLAAIAASWLGRPVQVVEFVGAWLAVEPAQQTVMPKGALGTGQFNRLGVDAAVGARVWHPQARVLLRIGPLGWQDFARLLPGRPDTKMLVTLIQAYLGLRTAFGINLVLRADDIPRARIGAAELGCVELGRVSWLGSRHDRARTDADDVAFVCSFVC
jgi:type VI secretion system protein ImpH